MPRKPRNSNSPSYKSRMGYEGEYGLVRKFVDDGRDGCYAVRTPGSGSGKMAKPDIIAVDAGELLAIEVKSSSRNYAMLEVEQVRRLREFARRFRVSCPHCGKSFNPKPVVAIRFLGRGWKYQVLPLEGEDQRIILKWDSSR
ncbi:hypothetical protein HRbin01_00970 [archaeon HR01]|nr:hypothetical protein HRbin01_00970 [archaeon HR01]